MKTTEIITNEQIDQVWGNANFGDMGKRDLIKETLFHCACGYKSGRTAEIICRELGLISAKWKLTEKGEDYLWEVYQEADNKDAQNFKEFMEGRLNVSNEVLEYAAKDIMPDLPYDDSGTDDKLQYKRDHANIQYEIKRKQELFIKGANWMRGYLVMPKMKHL